MKKRLGRPPLKAKERKEIFPLRLSAMELKALRDAAGDEPLAKWMRRKLMGTPEGELPKLSPVVAESIKRDSVDEALRKMAVGLSKPREGSLRTPKPL